jgi:hypothetical protein
MSISLEIVVLRNPNTNAISFEITTYDWLMHTMPQAAGAKFDSAN